MAFTQSPSLSNNPKILCVGRVYVWSSFLSMSVCICLCPFMSVVCIVSVCVHCVYTWWQIRRCWKVQRQQLCLGTLPTWGSAQPRCKVNSFNFLHPSFRRNLELICQRRSTSVKGWNVAKNVQSVTHHILYTCPLSLSASPLQPFHAIRLDYPRGHSHSTWWQKPIAKNVDIFTVHFQYLRV